MSDPKIIFNNGEPLRSIYSESIGFPVSMASEGFYMAKVEQNRMQGEVWHPIDGRQIEKLVRRKLKARAER